MLLTGLVYQRPPTIDNGKAQNYAMQLLSRLNELLTSLRRSKKNKGEAVRAWQKCDACGQQTQYFVVFLYKSSLICHKCYEEDTWLAKIKQKEAITNGGF